MDIKEKISIHKETLLTAAVVLICLFLYSIFPTNNIFQQIISSLTFLLVIPLLYIRIILRGSLKNYGVRLGDRRKGVIWMGLSVLASLLVFYILFHYTSLFKSYGPPDFITNRFALFILYELFLVGFFTILYEFFFRGIIILGPLKVVGYWSIVIQFALFTLFFAITGGFDWSIILYSITAPFSGIVAYQSRSILYSFGASLLFIIIADALAIGLTKS